MLVPKASKEAISGLSLFLSKVEKDITKKAVYSGLNRIADRGRTYAVKKVKGDINLSRNEINKVIKRRRVFAMTKDIRDMHAHVYATKKMVPLYQFYKRTARSMSSIKQAMNQKGIPVRKRKPIQFKIKKKKVKSKRVFLAKMKSGHIGLFYRVRGGWRKKDKTIKEAFSTKTHDLFHNQRIQESIINFCESISQKTFTSAFKRYLKKLS